MFIGYLLLAIALAELGFGVWFILRYRDNQTAAWYGLFAISSGIYAGCNGIGFTHVLLSGDLAEHISWVGGTLATAFFLAFSYSFPFPRKKITELLPLVLWPILIFVPTFLFSDLLVRHVTIPRYSLGYQTAEGPYLWVFLVFLAFYLLWSLWNLFRTFRMSEPARRKQTMVLLAGTIISLLVTVIFDIYYPLGHASHVGYLGSLFTAAWLASAAYVILKK